MEIELSSTKATQELAEKIVPLLKGGAIIALYGELGSGKTTFTNYLVKALNIDSRVQSPTFVLLRKYVNKNTEAVIKSVNHLDLYRLTSLEEIIDIGLDEILEEKNAITLIEWPEVAEPLLPKNCIKMKFEVVSEFERKVYVENLH